MQRSVGGVGARYGEGYELEHTRAFITKVLIDN